MAATCTVKNIIRPSDGTERIRFKQGGTSDIITVIMDMDAVADKYINTDAVECLRGQDDYDTLRNVFNFVKSNLTYRPDARGKEKIKSPAALFRMRSGDCKSFSIAQAAILKALGFKNIKYRFTSYTNSRDVTHVYTVVKLHGEDVIMDAVHGKFDDEVPYAWKMDKKAAGSSISGIGGIFSVSPNIAITAFSFALIGWGLFKLSK